VGDSPLPATATEPTRSTEPTGSTPPAPEHGAGGEPVEVRTRRRRRRRRPGGGADSAVGQPAGVDAPGGE
ncbi:MAG TPA: hypothetical protein VIR27_16535, partial [Mycobacteriales bacterium]